MISAILEVISQFVLDVISAMGYGGVFLLMALESANVPIPSEVIMPFSGFLVAQGVFHFWTVVFVGALGNLAGSLFSYWLGYLVRHNVLGWNNHAVTAEVDRARAWMHRFGDSAAFVSRLLPVVRTFISFPLGVLGVRSLWRFSLLTFAGSFLFSTLMTWLGFTLGQNWTSLRGYFHQFDYVILGVIVVGVVWMIWLHFAKKLY